MTSATESSGTPTELRRRLVANGYSKLTAVRGKVPAGLEWQKRTLTPESVTELEAFPNSTSTGIVCGSVIAIDVDLLQQEAADAVERAIMEWFPGARLLVRYGKAPKRLFIFATAQPFSKITASLVAPEDTGLDICDGRKRGGPRLEVLGEGQQFVAFGIHEDTGEPYHWPDGSPLDIRLDELPEISEDSARALIAHLEDVLREHLGYRVASSTASEPSEEAPHVPQKERFEKTEYKGVHSLNQFILEFAMKRHDDGIPCEDVIEESLARVREIFLKIPDEHPDKATWDWNKQKYQIGKSVYGDIIRRVGEHPRLADLLPNKLLQDWRAIERRGGTPMLAKKKHWYVKDAGPAEEIPTIDEEIPTVAEEIPTVDPLPRKYRFQVIDFEDMRPDSISHYLVDELLPEKGIGMVWGKPKCLKSFVVLDLCFHIARGMSYHDRAVRQGGVVYCAFEGGYGYKKRVAALRIKYKLDENEPNGTTPLKIVPASAPNLVKDHTQLVREVREQIGNMLPRVVVLDTLNKSMPGSEGKDADMAAYIKAAEAIRDAFDCLVLIVHHCGWDESRPRGHSSLPGAVDVQLRVERNANAVVVEVELMRDGPEGTQVHLVAEEVTVGIDERSGKKLTSLVLNAADTPIEIARKKGGRPSTIAPAFERALAFALENRGETFKPDQGTEVRAVAEDHVKFYFDHYWVEGAGSDAKAYRNRRDAFREIFAKWVAEGRLLAQCDDHNRSLMWLPIKDTFRE
jgi:hypothetical protein